MKLIDQMSHEEIINLGAADLERMVMYVCATEGIKMLPEPVKPKKPDIHPDMDAYQLDDFYSFTREPLDEIALVFSKNRSFLRTSEYNWNVGSDHKKTKIDEYQINKMTEVKPVKVFSDSHYAKVESELRQYKEAEKQYEEDLKEYNKYKSEREKATDWIWERFHDENAIEREFMKLEKAFEEYKRLADNNVDMAMAFLKKAYTVNGYQEERLVGTLCSNSSE